MCVLMQSSFSCWELLMVVFIGYSSAVLQPLDLVIDLPETSTDLFFAHQVEVSFDFMAVAVDIVLLGVVVMR